MHVYSVDGCSCTYIVYCSQIGNFLAQKFLLVKVSSLTLTTKCIYIAINIISLLCIVCTIYVYVHVHVHVQHVHIINTLVLACGTM